ncbi:MAG: hypothetical protein Q4G68_08555, partial [Planctomycetia bacterium]|nr:hypothetical protein [Planctomycetia bacterium]
NSLFWCFLEPPKIWRAPGELLRQGSWLDRTGGRFYNNKMRSVPACPHGGCGAGCVLPLII